jgi:ATP-dependent protease ClpP protease subunit
MSRMRGFALPAEATATVEASRARKGALRAQLGGDDRRWYNITNVAADEAELLLFNEIGGWFGTYADEFDAELKAITASHLTVRLNSPGGSVTEGIAIASALRSHPADITIRVDGIAASIASVIAMAGDRLLMMPGSMLMVHEAFGECVGDSAEMIKMAEVLDVISDNIASMYAAKAGGTADEWRERMRAETWFKAEDAVAAGLADGVVQSQRSAPEQDAPEMRQPYDLKAYGYTGPAAPPPALTIDIGSLLGEEFVAALRASVQAEFAAPTEPVPADPEPVPAVEVEPVKPEQPTESEPAAEPEDPAATVPEVEPEPVAPVEPAAPELVAPEPEPVVDPEPVPEPTPINAWAAAIAHLTTPAPDPWSAAFAHLIAPPSPSAATNALKEAS